jgi:dolichol-phosphate mannosyltransferase
MTVGRAISIGVRAAALAVAVARLARAARPAPPVVSASTDQVPVTIAVVVPARNEAARIAPLLTALRDAAAVTEVVVVDDQSDDGTAEVAARLGARVVPGSERPEGWAGKTWAVQQGIGATTSDWVVTLDADTRPDPRLPLALVARAIAEGADLATVAGRFECPTRGVAWLHPAMLTTLVYRFGPPGAARRPDRLLANGQCMVLRRSVADLSPVAAETVEDVALARHLAAGGHRVAMYEAPDLLTTRMYESLADTWTGWGRSLALPGVEPRRRQLADLAVLALAQALPLPRVLLGRGDLVDAVALLMRVGTLGGTRRAYPDAAATYWLSPLADAAAVAAVARGIVARRQTWRGRTYG